MATIYRGRVGARMAPPRGPRTVQTKGVGRHTVPLINGPWRGYSLRMAGHQTLVLEIRGQRGAYTNGAWGPA